MNELVVSTSEDGRQIGILEDRKIVELHQEKTNKMFSVGDIILGRVKKIVPGLNAAFVDIGHPREAFLHYQDLGPQVRSLNKYLKAVQAADGKIESLASFPMLPDIDKKGKMASVLKNGQPILVQVAKEAISTKGPRLTCEFSLPGQYLILIPFANYVSISRKIESGEEKKRLRVITESIRPANFAVILRTAAEGKDLAAIKGDMDDLIAKWDGMMRAAVKAKPPKKVLSEDDRTTSILRDMLSIGFNSIHTDDKDTYDEISEYLRKKMPDFQKILKLYKGKVPLFETMGIERQIKASFGKTVTMANGTYLVIEHTEALHVIDVNSGSKNLKGATLEDNALKTNMIAAQEIARQLRLRDMGGIIVIDFIDLKKAENKKALFNHFREVMKTDRAKHSILPMSRFGLVQITRERVRPEINIVTTEQCPSCGGTGKIQPTILIVDEISTNIDFLIKQNNEKSLTIKVHPYVQAYLTKGFMNMPRKWFLKYWRKIRIESDDSIPFSEVQYFNSKGDTINLQA